MEFSDGALVDPVAVFVVGLGYSLVSRLGDIAAFTLAVSFLGGVRSVGFVLGPALNHQSVRVGEFNVNTVLRNAGQFTLEMVGFLGLVNVKARSERAE